MSDATEARFRLWVNVLCTRPMMQGVIRLDGKRPGADFKPAPVVYR